MKLKHWIHNSRDFAYRFPDLRDLLLALDDRSTRLFLSQPERRAKVHQVGNASCLVLESRYLQWLSCSGIDLECAKLEQHLRARKS